jgi:dihydrodipicolinate synthase/N-acetylneuraminate lyase
MMPQRLEGIVPILLTPFDALGRIDTDSLEALIDFNIASGVHGLGVALGSEIFKFNEPERAALISKVVQHVAGRVPVVANTGAAGTDLAVYYSRMAAEAGIDAVMVIPPFFMPASVDEIIHYYATIAGAVDLPIILQDVPQAPISPQLALAIAALAPTVRYAKVETLPVVARVAAMTEAVSDQLTIIGGAGGSYFIEEMRRGARATMPFSSQPAEFVEVWNRFQAGDEAGARRAFDSTIMAVNRLAAQAGDLAFHVHKQILVRRGIIASAAVRAPTMSIDATTQREIDMTLAAIGG